MTLISLHDTVEGVKAAVEAADPALSREVLIDLGVKEKAGANRKTLLKYLRERAKGLPVEDIAPPPPNPPGSLGSALLPDEVDAPGEPPPDYVPTAEAPAASKPLMQPIDPRPCVFPFHNTDENLNPVCSIHDSGICFPCSQGVPPVNRCRVVCFAESDKHHKIEQPDVVKSDHTVEGNPATVEMVNLSEFDE